MRILCAGPTTITPEVEGAMQGIVTNPDLDPAYETFHRNVEKRLSRAEDAIGHNQDPLSFFH